MNTKGFMVAIKTVMCIKLKFSFSTFRLDILMKFRDKVHEHNKSSDLRCLLICLFVDLNVG